MGDASTLVQSKSENTIQNLIYFCYREGFISKCLEFQEFIGRGENAGAGTLLMEKEFLENEINTFSKKNTALQNSMKAFVDEVLEDLQGCIAGTLCTVS